MKRFLLNSAAAVLCTVAAKAQTVPTAAEDSVRMFRLQEVEVTATRATTTTPVAYANLSHETIARNSYGYDIPSVLALTPSMIACESGLFSGTPLTVTFSRVASVP